MPYTVTPTNIPDLLIIEPKVFGDARGFFFESFNQQDFNQATGLNVQFVQDNHSRSAQGVLRGLHYQLQQPQGKLVRVVRGAVFDVAVDIRQNSPTFGQWAGIELTEDNHKQVWVPPGFAHGFVVLSETADFCTKRQTITRLSTSAASPGTTPPSASLGLQACNRNSPPKTNLPNPWPKQNFFSCHTRVLIVIPANAGIHAFNATTRPLTVIPFPLCHTRARGSPWPPNPWMPDQVGHDKQPVIPPPCHTRERGYP